MKKDIFVSNPSNKSNHNHVKGWVREEESVDGERFVKIQLQDATTTTKVIISFDTTKRPLILFMLLLIKKILLKGKKVKQCFLVKI